MAQFNSLNAKLSNSQLNKLYFGNKSVVALRLSPSMIGNSDDKINFPNELVLTNRQVQNLRKASANNSSTDFKKSKT